jgi:hypothetical protein
VGGDAIFAVHGLLRYAVLVMGVAAALVALVGWRRGDVSLAGPERGTMAAFLGLLDIQVLLGVLLLVFRPFYPMLIGHLVMMVLAVVVGHAGSILARRRSQDRPAASVRFITAIATVLLVVGGIMAIGRPVL